MLLLARFFAAIGFIICFVVSAALSADSSQTVLVQGHANVEVDSQIWKSLAHEKFRFEQHFPRGSRVYYIDQYLVKDGNDYALFPIRSSIYRDRSALYVTDLIANIRERFSARSTISRQLNTSEVILRPDENPDRDLQEQISIGSARFAKMLLLQQSAPAISECIADLELNRAVRSYGSVPSYDVVPNCSGGSGYWVGGGSDPKPFGTITSFLNQCLVK